MLIIILFHQKRDITTTQHFAPDLAANLEAITLLAAKSGA
jgi:hypothetical protein